MSKSFRNDLVFTIKDRCRVCYTCVRECPVKAIQINNGQAQVVSQRCIGCGNCVKVCSQNAKVFLQSKYEVNELLESGQKVAAIIAPSFPAEFVEIEDYKSLVGMLRSLGFSTVAEVSFGADMVAREYSNLINNGSNEGEISSDCPAIVYYIKHYHPNLTHRLSPIVSPMVAMTRILRAKEGDNLRVVFIGPCVAKKAESQEVDEAITFRELREMFEEKGITARNSVPTEFDPPHSGRGSIFSISRGMMQTAGIMEDVSERNIIIAEGSQSFKDAIREFEGGVVSDHHLSLLCCKGCIMGPGMSKGTQRYARRTKVGNYVRQKLKRLDTKVWQTEVDKYSMVDFSTEFQSDDRRLPNPHPDEIESVLNRMDKFQPQDHLNCGSCGYDTCYEHANAIINGYAEIEMCLPHTIEKLHRSVHELNISNDKLASAKQQLMQSEKLAHMGQLSAGIAHELNNPLGVITMYANLLLDEYSEEDARRHDVELIVEQTARCRKIVGGLLNFARKNQVVLSETDAVELTRRSIESVVKPPQVTIQFYPNLTNPVLPLDADQMMQVLTNLVKNAIEALPETGGEIIVELTETPSEVNFIISDTGTGILKENLDKIFTPFFTTKEVGKGTGLGLPLIYGIVKMHKGKISVHSNANPEESPTGTTFTISLPKHP